MAKIFDLRVNRGKDMEEFEIIDDEIDEEILEEFEEIDENINCYVSIYPFDPTEGECVYGLKDLADFSKRAIETYNKDKDKRYDFVELVEAFLHSTFHGDSITAYFNACRPGDMKNVTFVASTECPLGDLSIPHPEIICVCPFPDSESGVPAPLPSVFLFPDSCPGTSSNFGSELGDPKVAAASEAMDSEPDLGEFPDEFLDPILIDPFNRRYADTCHRTQGTN